MLHQSHSNLKLYLSKALLRLSLLHTWWNKPSFYWSIRVQLLKIKIIKSKDPWLHWTASTCCPVLRLGLDISGYSLLHTVQPFIVVSTKWFASHFTPICHLVSQSHLFNVVCCSERAAADSSQMRELEGILAEAKSLESYLKEKKTHLRQTLAVISDKLLG